MDGRKLLLILLLELWHLESMSACTILALLILKLRQRRHEQRALDNRSFIRCETRLIYLDSMIGNSDIECVNELRMDRRAFGLLCELLRNVGRVKNEGLVSVEEQVCIFLHTQSEGTRKRKRVDDADKLIVALSQVFEDSGKRMQMVTEAILKGNEDRSDIAKELKEMGLSPLDQIAALKHILGKPEHISIFKSLDDEVKEVFVQTLLMENGHGAV